MTPQELTKILKRFWLYRKKNQIEIYNEFSFQHELGIYLRKKLKGYKVEFERNVEFFEVPKEETIKHEMDIVVYTPDKKEKYVIELKNPRNGQVPEQMYQFAKDIKFLEQLVQEQGFDGGFFICLTSDPLFYEGNDKQGIYSYFRNGKKIHGTIVKPTGAKDERFEISGTYSVKWKDIPESEEKYLIVGV